MRGAQIEISVRLKADDRRDDGLGKLAAEFARSTDVSRVRWEADRPAA